jgi:hypothetical protein
MDLDHKKTPLKKFFSGGHLKNLPPKIPTPQLASGTLTDKKSTGGRNVVEQFWESKTCFFWMNVPSAAGARRPEPGNRTWILEMEFMENYQAKKEPHDRLP